MAIPNTASWDRDSLKGADKEISQPEVYFPRKVVGIHFCYLRGE